MTPGLRHSERHLVARIGWLRAAVLGANDGIVSTASLIVGVSAASPEPQPGLDRGRRRACRWRDVDAAGEYVSVSSQADTDQADIARESVELSTSVQSEREELTQIYVTRGIDRPTAEKVSDQLMAHDALGAHTRDELGIWATTKARPIQAALTSAATFTLGAAMPIAMVLIAPIRVVTTVALTSLASLALLGAIAARAGGAPVLKSVLRVTFLGALAMALTAALGRLVGTAV